VVLTKIGEFERLALTGENVVVVVCLRKREGERAGLPVVLISTTRDGEVVLWMFVEIGFEALCLIIWILVELVCNGRARAIGGWAKVLTCVSTGPSCTMRWMLAGSELWPSICDINLLFSSTNCPKLLAKFLISPFWTVN
jgi:hypothetical protein